MFERFTESSRAVLVDAQDLALELGSPYIETGHLLYGCAEGREETAGKPLQERGITGASIRLRLPRAHEQTPADIDLDALGALGIDYDAIRTRINDTFGDGALEAAPDRRGRTTRTRKPPFTPRAKRALELALRVAQELHHHRITPGHLLLGLLRVDDEFVTATLEDTNTTLASLTAAVLTRLSSAA